MFEKKLVSLAENTNQSQTFIAKGVKVEGDFDCDGSCSVFGEMKGRVSVLGLFQAGEGSKIEAEIKAQSAVIAGSVKGNIHVAEHIELSATAEVIGDLECKTLTVLAGAFLSGKVVMIENI